MIGGLILNLKIYLSTLAVGASEQLHALYKNEDIQRYEKVQGALIKRFNEKLMKD